VIPESETQMRGGGVNVTSRQKRPAAQAGFALVVALLALVLLTFLGLTLALTTSTELTISTNYRWNQQALYNAEAGLEMARALLARVGDGQLVLPESRTGSWVPVTNAAWTPTPPLPRFTSGITRNFEGSACDRFGNGAGYGQVLVDPNNPGRPYENITQPVGTAGTDPRLNGAFTVWVRRDLLYSAGLASDNPVGENIIVTSEGTAPFGSQTVFTRANRAIRRLESRVIVREGCRPSAAQTSSTGFSDCELL
jgi:hypothetical protein